MVHVDLDAWIDKLRKCEHLEEDELKTLCEMVRGKKERREQRRRRRAPTTTTTLHAHSSLSFSLSSPPFQPNTRPA